MVPASNSSISILLGLEIQSDTHALTLSTLKTLLLSWLLERERVRIISTYMQDQVEDKSVQSFTWTASLLTRQSCTESADQGYNK